ncbi:MAG: hypothetical protein EZS28_000510 [Streblomastix strix]|uniref:Uncharacterized protein n=1 Tax=Streblomastix strix TaxID=222440 RepID=A0A5J4X9X1_9EUKA|nr:MAG: hypothetical protein EZS28_000510 [Streblomastix strix]
MSQREVKTKKDKSVDTKRPKGRPKNKSTVANVIENMFLKKRFTHLGQTANSQNIAKDPQILKNLGKLQLAQSRIKQSDYSASLRQINQTDNRVSAHEADAGIYGLKGNVRKERIQGSYDPMGSVHEANQTKQMVQQFFSTIIDVIVI